LEEASQPKPRLRIARHVMAAEHIGRRIVSGELRPGTTLPNSTELARQLSIARPALREALELLAGKGLVESTPRRGTVVRSPDVWSSLDEGVLSDPDGARSALRALLIKSESDALTGLRAKEVAQ
jgi:DNA-binding FadR family transcriptional regulator